MAWMILFLAGLFEVVWAIGLKYSAGFTRLAPSIVTALGMIISVYLLSAAAKTLPIGTAYAVWTGIGAVGAVVLGIFLFNESRDPLRLLFVAIIVAGIIGLRFVSGGE